jgi:hypothetical protein
MPPTPNVGSGVPARVVANDQNFVSDLRLPDDDELPVRLLRDRVHRSATRRPS